MIKIESKQELAGLILSKMLNQKLSTFLGKRKIKKLLEILDSNTCDQILSATGFYNKLGPMMAISADDYLKEFLLQIAQIKIDYENEMLKEFSISLFYCLLKQKNIFSSREILSKYLDYEISSILMNGYELSNESIRFLTKDLIQIHCSQFEWKGVIISEGDNKRFVFC